MAIFTGVDDRGELISYRDGKRYLYLFSVFLPTVPLLSIGLYFWSHGAVITTLVPLLFIYGFVPLADAILGEDRNNPPPEVVAAMEADPYYRYLAWATVPIFWISFIATAIFVGTQHLPLWAMLALALGVGTIDGGCIALGHELGHKQSKLDQVIALFANNVVGYAHFRVEHNRGHHTWVSTPEDPASSRMGETIYAFAARELPGAFLRGWRNEAERLSRRGKAHWSTENEVLQGFALTFAVAAVLIAMLGMQVAPFILLHHFIGWYGLTQANYVEHYGLLRQRLANGRYQPVEPRHSWNTNHIFSNLLTFHLQRHSDHHAHPMRPYQSLRDFPDLPRLPSGYPGMFVLAAIPPLWFRVMDPKVIGWAGGDVSKINIAPQRVARGALQHA
ncbi:MAG: alkane 1-monooxygenase [Proteobacteria bacterium]|nr:alkane 1-monooxygenase [Pseudomonadota bacterium]